MPPRAPRLSRFPRLSRPAVAAAALAATAAVLATTPPAAADTRFRDSGTAVHVVDGDTEDVVVDGRKVRVRNAGIQAFEVGHCHASSATHRLAELVGAPYDGSAGGRHVRLYSRHAGSKNHGRDVRFVHARRSDGSYVDVQLALLKGGYVVVDHFNGEDDRQQTYRVAMEQAAERGRELWDKDFCGSGPAQSARLRMWINYDANGDDRENVNGEYVRVQNAGDHTVDLGGWWLRDATHDPMAKFPKGTSLSPGEIVTVRTGKGKDTAHTIYRGLSAPQFTNQPNDDHVGGLALLIDPDGDVRSHVSYPCVPSGYDCASTLKGQVRISRVKPNADGSDTDPKHLGTEWVEVRNVGRHTVSLTRKVVSAGGWQYEFGSGTTLRAGESLRVHTGTGTTTRTGKYFGRKRPLLANDGGRAVLRTPSDYVLDTCSWGKVRSSAPRSC